MVELVDLYPTLTELTDLDAPAHLQGTSIVPILQDPNLEGSKPYAYNVVTRGKSLGYAMRNQRLRYGKWAGGEELYNLDSDPHERNNLAQDPQYEQRLAEWRTVTGQETN